jgi:hypothetical protein
MGQFKFGLSFISDLLKGHITVSIASSPDGNCLGSGGWMGPFGGNPGYIVVMSHAKHIIMGLQDGSI